MISAGEFRNGVTFDMDGKVMQVVEFQHVKRRMLHAAKNGLTFHLWWHPHNIGVRTAEHMTQLEEIFRYYAELKEKYGMASRNMREAAEK